MPLCFRQVHLDFHNAGSIPGIGERFDKKEFQEILTEAAVDSITCFSLCHHGWSYHPTEVGAMHPELSFDLLRAQLDAAHEAGIHAPVYLSAGGNEVAAELHPEWREIQPPGVRGWRGACPGPAGFRKLCFNTPYLDYLCRLIDEAVRRYPDADGIFLDIALQRQCVCPRCVEEMRETGLDPDCEADRCEHDRQVMLRYYEATTNASRKYDPAMPVFHNSGHFNASRLDLLPYFSHLELESLPTGGWGYDHFPQSAAFARKTGLEFLGMTGKFHGNWGEFGGFKHPNALRYECCAMIAAGARCSIGDQLHPSGALDLSTYRLIGNAYREVRDKEPFCRDAENLADIALLPAEAFGLPDCDGDIGAGRILLEGHFLFDALHPDMDFNRYKLVILPGAIPLNGEFAARLKRYHQAGGKILFTGAVPPEGEWDFGAEIGSPGPFDPTYVVAAHDREVTTPFVCYGRNLELTVREGSSLGQVHYPYFNRAPEHFSGHAQTPFRPEPSGFDAGVIHHRLGLFAHPVFAIYRQHGATVLRHFITRAIDTLLGDDKTLGCNLPSLARASLTHNPKHRRYVVHLLYAPIVQRGSSTGVIEELLPLQQIQVSVKLPEPVREVRLEPEGTPLPFHQTDGIITIKIDSFTCHGMVALYY